MSVLTWNWANNVKKQRCIDHSTVISKLQDKIIIISLRNQLSQFTSEMAILWILLSILLNAWLLLHVPPFLADNMNTDLSLRGPEFYENLFKSKLDLLLFETIPRPLTEQLYRPVKVPAPSRNGPEVLFLPSPSPTQQFHLTISEYPPSSPCGHTMRLTWHSL